MTERRRKTGSSLLWVLLMVMGAISLLVHFQIYRQTSASAFINQPQFYYNRFVVRDCDRQSIGEVSLKTGFWSYATAALTALLLTGGTVGVVFQLKTKRPSLVATTEKSPRSK